jgi:hypothetical protein
LHSAGDASRLAVVAPLAHYDSDDLVKVADTAVSVIGSMDVLVQVHGGASAAAGESPHVSMKEIVPLRQRS